MIPVATEKAGLPDDWSVVGAAVFAGIGVVVVRPHLYSIRSSPQGIVVASGWRVALGAVRRCTFRRHFRFCPANPRRSGRGLLFLSLLDVRARIARERVPTASPYVRLAYPENERHRKTGVPFY